MDLTAIERQIQEEVLMGLRLNERPERGDLEESIRKAVHRLPRDVRKQLGDQALEVLIQRVSDTVLGFGPLQSLLEDPSVTEIMVLAPDTIYIERDGIKQLASDRFLDAAQVRVIVERMMTGSGRRLDETQPYCDFALDDGSRVHVIIPPLALKCPQITIRKFLGTINDIDDLVNFGTLDPRMAQFLVACMRGRKNLLFSGATGSGKTTTLSAMSHYLDPQERIIIIEDTRELNLAQEHVVSLITKSPNIEGAGEVTLRDLVRNTLRMRPSRILLGEIRGAEAMDFLQALNSGHRGCSAVLHASAPDDAVRRLETLALYAGLNLPVHAIRQQISSGLDIIIQQEQQSDGSRKITHITEVLGMEGDQVQLQDLYRYELLSTDSAGQIEGQFTAVASPADLSYFEARGIALPAALFENGAP